MDVKNEIKSLIAKRGMTLKQVCQILSEKTGKSYSGNNITNKLRRKTIKFEEVQLIFAILGYKLEYSEQ
ncbi:MAG: hypothetical protein PHX18_04695 [Candidatus Gastranaerophilales bacterium]|nr:hypothetical protein [Candidatus Gastranaerophilales bacterium]